MGKASRRNRQKNPQGFKKSQQNAAKKSKFGTRVKKNSKGAMVVAGNGKHGTQSGLYQSFTDENGKLWTLRLVKALAHPTYPDDDVWEEGEWGAYAHHQ
tara:strand:+ start:424 stop:720 length:297 start_codon:yes stop_codon:yes gene_type:complete